MSVFILKVPRVAVNFIHQTKIYLTEPRGSGINEFPDIFKGRGVPIVETRVRSFRTAFSTILPTPASVPVFKRAYISSREQPL